MPCGELEDTFMSLIRPPSIDTNEVPRKETLRRPRRTRATVTKALTKKAGVLPDRDVAANLMKTHRGIKESMTVVAWAFSVKEVGRGDLPECEHLRLLAVHCSPAGIAETFNHVEHRQARLGDSGVGNLFHLFGGFLGALLFNRTSTKFRQSVARDALDYLWVFSQRCFSRRAALASSPGPPHTQGSCARQSALQPRGDPTVYSQVAHWLSGYVASLPTAGMSILPLAPVRRRSRQPKENEVSGKSPTRIAKGQIHDNFEKLQDIITGPRYERKSTR
ncbi:hypothetical protein FA13DRAFT_1712812 [Coprinellus micaceus]|uniref:Uncharacterized protein n=1 Tax=Coprinellus micaceus TaxID=71717 RepID=A0A4Y7SYU1_COPMI|nr:hypothetical protein FA13DRAFT_1712812 [Coprinellus micaceus]